MAELERLVEAKLPAPRRSLALGGYLQGKLSLTEASKIAGLPEAGFSALAEQVCQTIAAWPVEDVAPAPELSIVIPVYNEEEMLAALWEHLVPLLRQVSSYEVIFVNDGSADKSASIILELRTIDPSVKLINLSRNFGHQAALTAGLDCARGAAVVLMDADLQDPPELLLDFMQHWRLGYHVVYAVRQKRKEGFLKRSAYGAFYRLLRLLSYVEMPLDAGDFCLMDQRVVHHIRALPEKQKFLRGLRSWVGFRQIGVPYERPARHAGQTKYTLRKLVQLALDGLLAFTSAPLRLAVYAGFVTGAIGILFLLYAIGYRIWIGDAPQDWTSIVAIILMLGGASIMASVTCRGTACRAFSPWPCETA